MDRTRWSLFLTFFAGSWVSNLSIIRTTTALLQGPSLELILAVSSCAGLAFFLLLRLLARFQRPTLAAWLMLPAWLFCEAFAYAYPDLPIWPALGALLFGELVKWHAYSQVLLRFGPLSAGRVIDGGVLAYELGTVGAALTATAGLAGWLRAPEILAVGLLYLPFLLGKETEAPRPEGRDTSPNSHRLLWPMLSIGMVAGFLRVSADTGFKFAVSTTPEGVGSLVAHYYLVSAGFTMGLALTRRLRWFTPRSGCPQASLKAQASAQIVFALSLFSGNMTAIVVATALQRSLDKIFYQPTIQLLTSGFAPAAQEWLRQTHVTAFLCLGSFLGFLAFLAHGLFPDPQGVLLGMSVLHLLGAFSALLIMGVVVKHIVYALDREAKLAGVLGGSRPMAMLAMLSPRHFLVHALLWSKKNGKGISPELLEGLTTEEAGGEVVESFYAAFSDLNESHQLALIRMAVFLDRETDRAFLIAVASEVVNGSLRARRLAAIHVVKTHGRIYRPLLRRARGKNSPLPGKKIA